MPLKGRRGTKNNPFEIGERVRLRVTAWVNSWGCPEKGRKLSDPRVGRLGVILKVQPADYGGHISYLVEVEDVGKLWLYARELEVDTLAR